MRRSGWEECSNSRSDLLAIPFATAENSPPVAVTQPDPEASVSAAWIDSLGIADPDASEEADPDGDGHNNVDEFAFGALPVDPVSFPRPAAGTHAGPGNGSGFANLAFTRRFR